MKTALATLATVAWTAGLLAMSASVGALPVGVLAVGLTMVLLGWAATQLQARRRDAAREAQISCERQERAREWLAHVWELGPLPTLDVASRDALADLIEVMTGGEALWLRDLYVKHGLLQADIDEAQSRDRATRLAAIARLARVRQQGALRVLQVAAQSQDAATTREALRAMARTVAFSRPTRAIDQLIKAMYAANVPPAELEVLARLTRDRAEALIERLLRAEDSRYELAAIRTIGRLRLVKLAHRLWAYLGEAANPASRAAALTALAETGNLPHGLERNVAAALLSSDKNVLEAAVRVAALIPERILPHLRGTMKHADPQTLRRVISALGAAGSTRQLVGPAMMAPTSEPPRTGTPGSRSLPGHA